MSVSDAFKRTQHFDMYLLGQENDEALRATKLELLVTASKNHEISHEIFSTHPYASEIKTAFKKADIAHPLTIKPYEVTGYQRFAETLPVQQI